MPASPCPVLVATDAVRDGDLVRCEPPRAPLPCGCGSARRVSLALTFVYGPVMHGIVKRTAADLAPILTRVVEVEVELRDREPAAARSP